MAYKRIWQTLAVVVECLRRNKVRSAIRWLDSISPRTLEGIQHSTQPDRGLDARLFLESLTACYEELTNENRASGLVWADKALAAWTRLGDR